MDRQGGSVAAFDHLYLPRIHRRGVVAHDVDSAMEDGPGSSRTKIVLRNGAIVIATGAVVAGAIAAVRYRRRHK